MPNGLNSGTKVESNRDREMLREGRKWSGTTSSFHGISGQHRIAESSKDETTEDLALRYSSVTYKWCDL